MLLEAVEHILAEAARVDDELAEVEEDGGDHGAHDHRRTRLLKVEAAMDSENLFEGQAGLVRAALQEALPRLPVWPCYSCPSESAPDQGRHGSTHGVFSRVAAF